YHITKNQQYISHNHHTLSHYRLTLFFFFFSSRRRHTRCYRDWSSDVCSSDLPCHCLATARWSHSPGLLEWPPGFRGCPDQSETRSEERRVGKECRSRWSAYH